MKCKFRFLFILFPIAFISIGALITMGLWNWLIPSMFGLGSVTFLQAAGILILARLLFGWKGKYHHGWHGPMQYAHAGDSCHPHSHFRKAWMHHHGQNLTAEQREKFAGRCGHPFEKEQDPE